MRPITGTVVAVATAVAAACAFASAASADLACKQEAKADYLACKQECKEEFRAAKLTCRNIDPTCGTPCLAARQACRDSYEDILATGQLPGGGTLADCATGTDGCRDQLAADKAACGAPCDGDPTCDACVDAAQVTSFICRDTCRERWRADPVVAALKETCKTTFQACIGACPPAP
jgi:hypothetical protein